MTLFCGYFVQIGEIEPDMFYESTIFPYFPAIRGLILWLHIYSNSVDYNENWAVIFFKQVFCNIMLKY